MADNYLEKKMEQHKVRTVSQAVPKRNNLYSLLEHSMSHGAFDGYVVREDQLVRIVAAAARAVAPMSFRFRLVFGDEAVALRSCCNDMIKATAYIVICPCAHSEIDYLQLGRVVQVMLLQASEIGLCAAFVAEGLLNVTDEVLAMPQTAVSMLAFGRSAEPLLPFERGICDADIKKLII